MKFLELSTTCSKYHIFVERKEKYQGNVFITSPCSRCPILRSTLPEAYGKFLRLSKHILRTKVWFPVSVGE